MRSTTDDSRNGQAAARNRDIFRAQPGALTLREDGDSAPEIMEGHFAVFNEWTEINSLWEGQFMERISPGAFRKTFKESGDSIRVLFQHGRDPQIGSKVLGPIRELREDGNVGAFYAVELLRTDYNAALLPGLREGLYGASFRFRVMKEEFVEEPQASSYNPRALPERTIKEVAVQEFGPVTFPAYASATAGIRSLTDDFLLEAASGTREEPVELDDGRTVSVFIPEVATATADPATVIIADEPAPARVESGDQLNVTITGDASGLAEVLANPAAVDADPVAARIFAEAERESSDSATIVPDLQPALGGEAAPEHSDPPSRDDDASALTTGAENTHSVPVSRAPEDTNERTTSMPVLTELEARKTEIMERLQEITAENPGVALTPDLRQEWDDLEQEYTEVVRAIREDTARREFLADAARDSARTVPAVPVDRTAARPGRTQLPADIYAVEEYRVMASSYEELPGLYREGAMRAIDSATFPHPRAGREDVQEHVARLLDRDVEGAIAHRILATGRPAYMRAFGKTWAGQPLTVEEQRALSLTTTQGGFAVPFVLDPTIIPTSNSSVNPFRQIAKVEPIVSNQWRGVASAGVTANYRAEGAETTDDAPVLSQPLADVERADVFIPFSVEIGMDWPGLQAEMARLVQDAKDDLEADKFVTGLGHAANQPEGLNTGATAILSTVAATALSAADVYALETSLPPRFRPRASIVANRLQYSRVRQLDTAGGANLWIRIGDGLRNAKDGALGEALLGYPTYEASGMNSALTSGASIITIGDFSHFLIAERIGMQAEVVPHLLGSNRRPTLQRGLLFWWRNTSDVVAWQAFRTLKVT